MRLADIQMRDPFVLPVAEEQAYYLFGSTDPNIWSGEGIGFDCYRSTDLIDWEGPRPAFRPPPGFWSPGQYWAPEVHRYDDSWFLFATFTGRDDHRGTQVLRADRPHGPFTPWSPGPVTPDDWQCLDGTLHVDDGGPWLVFCHEWTQCGNGEVCAVRLSADLRQRIGEPTLLFRASEAMWARPLTGMETVTSAPAPHLVTDGPFLHRNSVDSLVMLWSSFGENGYAMGLARSSSDSVLGPWLQDEEPVWGADGGHGMLFRTFDGQLLMTLHQPNSTPNERAVFVPIDEIDSAGLAQ